jgi:hypothetical protein
MATNPKLFEDEIRKTGFVLENRVAQELKANGWTVISNKYYVDDSEETVREIDLVAYKSTRVQRFDVYTTLIISCKKSDSNAWALLARDINLKDPNSDFWPLHAQRGTADIRVAIALLNCFGSPKTVLQQSANQSFERTSSGKLSLPAAAAQLQRLGPGSTHAAIVTGHPQTRQYENSEVRGGCCCRFGMHE